ncbi:50S ribosomal subunit protein L23 [Gammaproteobacteria bacterium]
MNQERLIKVLRYLRISEKTVKLNANSNQATFRVLCDANKSEIKNAVELLFNVKVDTVQTVNVKGKIKRFGRRLGKRSDWKKAYVSLQPGFSIDMLDSKS